MILWHYQIRPKVVWNVVHGLMDTITRTKTKKLPLRRIKSVTFFVQCIIHVAKTYVIPHLVIADILYVILNNLHRLKQQQQASQIL